ncbi:unnamed protein product, partial [marine sediment metagenome]
YEQDMARQRDLERAGWQFVRIGGGDFYRDNDEALKPLWEELDRLGIKPGGIDESAAAPPAPMPQGISDDVGTNDSTRHNALSDDDDDPVESETVIRKSANSANSETGEPGSDEAESVSFPDPRTGKPWEVQAALVQVVSEHGPLPCHYAYRLYIKQAGFRKVSRRVEEVLSRCMKSAAARGEIELSDEYGNDKLRDKIARLVGAALVRLRPRGERNIKDIPPSELASLVRGIRVADCAVFATPVYFSDLSESLRAFLDRLRRITRHEAGKAQIT